MSTQGDVTKRPLPPGWRWVKLSDLIVTLESGSRPRGGALGIGSGVPSISAEHMLPNGTFDFSSLRYVPYEYYETMKRGHIRRGDILIVKDGATTGKTCFIDDTFPFRVAVVNEHVFILRVDNSQITPAFLFFWLWGPEGQSAIRANYQGSAIGGITQTFVEKVLVPVPRLPEQERLIAVLREQMAAVERARRAAEEQLEAAKALPAAFLRQVFPRAGQPLPAGWRWVKLGEVCEIRARQVDPKDYQFGALPHVNGENIESGLCRLKYLNTAAEEGMISGKYLFEKGDVLYSKLRPYLRKALVADFRGVCSADMYPIRVNPEWLDPYFTAWLLVSDQFTAYADKESRRARMPKLNRDQLFAWETPLPPLSEQKRIAAVLREQMAAAERARKAIEEQLETINKLPAAILRKAFNGEL